MYGIEAINAHNGWAMAVTGAIIVMTGLTILSFIISQLHRIIALFDARKDNKGNHSEDLNPIEKPVHQNTLSPLSALGDTMQRFKPLTLKSGSSFDLPALFQLFLQHDAPHPHLTIRGLREHGFLIPGKDGLFTWKQQ